ncbi:MAG TPA: hypothetical protein VIK51_15740, partial [Vicinamibacteria bacterium]
MARPPRATRVVVRAALWSLPIALGVLAFLLVGRARAKADLADAAQLILSGRPADARLLLERHRDSRRFGARAHAGLAVVALLEGAPVSDESRLADLTFYRPRTLMDAALRRGDFEASLRL